MTLQGPHHTAENTTTTAVVWPAVDRDSSISDKSAAETVGTRGAVTVWLPNGRIVRSHPGAVVVVPVAATRTLPLLFAAAAAPLLLARWAAVSQTHLKFPSR